MLYIFRDKLKKILHWEYTLVIVKMSASREKKNLQNVHKAYDPSLWICLTTPKRRKTHNKSRMRRIYGNYPHKKRHTHEKLMMLGERRTLRIKISYWSLWHLKRVFLHQ